MSNFFTSRAWKVFVVTFSITAPIFILSAFGEVFVLLVMSLVLTMVLKPLVDFLENKGIPRAGAILGLYVVFGGLVVIGLMTVYPVIVHQASNLSTSFNNEKLSAMLKDADESISKEFPFIKAGEVTQKFNDILPSIAQKAEETLTSAISLIASIIIVPFITFFLLLDYYKMQKAFVENVPNKYFEMTLNVIYKLENQLSKYIRGVCIESLLVAILYVIAYYIIGIQYATVLGLIGGLANVIPLAGPIIGAVPVIVVSIIQYGDFSMVVPIVVTTLVVQQLDEIFIQPNVYGKILNMHPLTIILVILIGSQILGVLGMILAIPIYTVITVTARETNWGLRSYKITH